MTQGTQTGQTVTVFASAARTATVDSGIMFTPNAHAMYVFIDVTAAAATPSVVFDVKAYDGVSTKTLTLLTSAAITGISTTVLRIGPDYTASANVTAKEYVPNEWYVTATHADTDSITYTVVAVLCG